MGRGDRVFVFLGDEVGLLFSLKLGDSCFELLVFFEKGVLGRDCVL